MKEMYFMAYLPEDEKGKKFISLEPDEFVKFIISNSCLNNYELLSEQLFRGRPLYKIF